MRLSKFGYVLAFMIGIALAGASYHSALAQCVDATGGSIPCPPEKEKKTKTPVPVLPVSTATATSLPLSAPNAISTGIIRKDINQAGCGRDDDAGWMLACVMGFVNDCAKAGGSATTSTNKDGGVDISCTVDAWMVIEPTPLPISAGPTPVPPPHKEGYLGQCTKADGDFFECAEQFTCEDGLLVIEVDLYDSSGTVYDFYCFPDKPTFPPGGWLPWITGLGGILIGLLLPAIQKVREAAARNPDEDEAMQLRAKRAEVPANNQDGTDGFHRLFGDSDGDAPPPPPPPPPAKK